MTQASPSWGFRWIRESYCRGKQGCVHRPQWVPLMIYRTSQESPIQLS